MLNLVVVNTTWNFGPLLGLSWILVFRQIPYLALNYRRSHRTRSEFKSQGQKKDICVWGYMLKKLG